MNVGKKKKQKQKQKQKNQHAPFMKTECDYLYGWIKKKNPKNTQSHLIKNRKNLTKNGETQTYSSNWSHKKKVHD